MSKSIKSLLKSRFDRFPNKFTTKRPTQPTPPRPTKPPTRRPTPPRPTKPPTRRPTPPRQDKPLIRHSKANKILPKPSELELLPIEIFCKIWDNLNYVPATYIKSSITINKNIADKIYFCTEKILLDTTINLTNFTHLKSVKIDYMLNNSQDIKQVESIFLQFPKLQIIFDDKWKYIDFEYEQKIYNDKKNNITTSNNTSLPYIQYGKNNIIKHLVKQLNMQQLKNLGNSIAISIIHDYNWNRVKCLLDTLFDNVSRKQRFTIICSMIQPWDLYSSGYNHERRIWFRQEYPKEYHIMTKIPKYLISKVDDITLCKNWDSHDFNWYIN